MNTLQSLLHRIAALYSHMFANVMHERVSAYHAHPGSDDDDDDIGTTLRAYIKHTKQLAAANTALSTHQSGVTEPALTSVLQPQQLVEISASPNANAVSNPLSEYFQKNNTHSDLAPPLVKKLQASAWEHTHSAIRLAHQGDFTSAKLHADLASNAIRQLGHYMSEVDFKTFKRAVKAELLDKA